MLASDLNNPEFVNPTNPDDALQVEFYDYESIDDWKTQEKNDGTIYRKPKCPFIRINTPGNVLNIIERPADARDVKRFPRQWMFYQIQTGALASGDNLPGYKIADWHELDHTTQEKLRYLGFVTVEQLAMATDSQIQAVGMGADGMRIRARKFVQERNRAEVNGAVAERDEKIAEQGKQIAMLAEKLDQALSFLAQQAERPAEPKQKRAYTKKQKEAPSSDQQVQA